MNPRFAVSMMVVGALTLAACGSESAGSDTAGLTGDPIKIGQIAPTGTSFYNVPDTVAVTRSAVDGVNRRGGIDGRPLELVYCNDKGDPNEAMACAREMISAGVVATVRSIVIAGGAQVSSVLGQAGIPDIGRAALEPAEFAAENAFLLDGGLTYPYAAGLRQFSENGNKRIYLSTSESANADSTLNNLERIAEDLGLEVVGKRKVPRDTADYSPFLLDIRQSGAEGVIAAFPQGTLLPLIKTADQVGLDIDWLMNGGGLTQDDLQALPKAQTERMTFGLNSIPYSVFDTAERSALAKEDIEHAFQGGDKDADPDNIFPNSWTAYESVAVLTEVLQGMDTITAASVTDELEGAEDIPLALSVAWTPSRQGPVAYPRVSNPFVFIGRFVDGRTQLASEEPVDVSEFVQ